MSEAKQSLAWIFFEEKDETLIHKEILKNNFLISFLTPSQNFLAENFTLPQGEGDYNELKKK
jgi:hypothetical protein